MFNPIENEMICLWRFELRCHMACTMNSSKSETFIFGNHTSCLSLSGNEPSSLGFMDWSVHGVNPVSCACRWDRTISVSGEFEHSVLTFEAFPYPLRADSQWSVVPVWITVAEIPLFVGRWDVKGLLDFVAVEVIDDWLSIYTRWNLT